MRRHFLTAVALLLAVLNAGCYVLARSAREHAAADARSWAVPSSVAAAPAQGPPLDAGAVLRRAGCDYARAQTGPGGDDVAYRLATSWALCGAQGGPASDMNALVFASNRDRDKAAADLLGSLGAALPGGVLVGDRFIVYGSSGLAGGLPPVAARVGGVIRPN